MNHVKKLSITMGIILVTILTTLAFAGQVLRQEAAGQDFTYGQIIEDIKKIQDEKEVLNTLSN